MVKQIPITINQRLSRISSDGAKFNKVKEDYQKALLESGHVTTLKYENTGRIRIIVRNAKEEGT